MIRIHWTGPVEDSSGYASCTRKYLKGLIESKEVNLSIGKASFEPDRTEHNESEMIRSYIRDGSDAPIHITHLTPENYPKYRKQGKYNIGYVAWETDKLPEEWVPLINLMDRIWCPSTWNKEVYERSGVNKPIDVIPHILECPDISDIPEFTDQKEGAFWFYSIFQWITRKNPNCLLQAYLTEFSKDENVRLVLKTYRKGFSIQEKNIIRAEIAKVKQNLHMSNFPPIYLISDLLAETEMMSLHKTGDCFVLPTRAEGFSLAHAAAMSYGNPSIGPNYSGTLDFMNKDNSFLIDTRITPVYGMEWMPHYRGNQNWGDPSIMDLRKKMRWVFTNREKAQQIGHKGKQTIKEKLNQQAITKLIIEKLKSIGG